MAFILCVKYGSFGLNFCDSQPRKKKKNSHVKFCNPKEIGLAGQTWGHA